MRKNNLLNYNKESTKDFYRFIFIYLVKNERDGYETAIILLINGKIKVQNYTR